MVVVLADFVLLEQAFLSSLKEKGKPRQKIKSCLKI
jgi:hypothetical protein